MAALEDAPMFEVGQRTGEDVVAKLGRYATFRGMTMQADDFLAA